MRPPRGSPRHVLANLRAPGLTLPARAAAVVRNALRRFGPPPRDCCDHPGQPGC